ncbi:metal ABC transporter substrate-binding protein [Cellulomonas sp. PhB143]|uniref:metal ABC transporter substrate-binding protein n=1 Tax=Cellulomonas sp. PhB143 TaxID=2485186 RepID=UPI000F46A872|nr:metal ABC transporter substrate-binding protein [Cellulomonas sp. PhB143]ROS73679.1 zinc transport system substrate-binding protein [Cellulomonas sp. PhB143]
MPLRSPARRALTSAGAAVTVVATAATLAACSPAADGVPTATSTASDGTVRLQVLASFYPLQFVAQRVGGDHAEVANLTPPAAEPHDLELSPAQVRAVGDADLVVYLRGFQAAVDDAVDARDATAVDAGEVADLERHPNGADADELETDDRSTSAEHEEGHEPAGAEGEDEHAHGLDDPHFWLDPTRLAAVVPAVEERLAEIDPEHATDYAANATALEKDLEGLDADYTKGLEPCRGAALVTSHEAFGYLAEHYDLDQIGIAGIDPENEPSPARLRDIRDVVEREHVTTIYTETLSSPKVTETFADDVGVATAPLDPIEGLADPDSDYLGIMRSNLTELTDGLTCS